jgi:hypothetical protein
MPRGKDPARTAPSRSEESSEPPALPAWKAFVVQFSRESEGRKGAVFAGRVEHLSSGRRARFNSPDELLRTLQTLLEELASSS